MKTRDVIDLLRHKSEHIKEKIKPEFFRECADHLEKYEWHDLRKNPEDLPGYGQRILFYTVDLSTVEYDDENEKRYWTGEYANNRFYNDDYEEYVTKGEYHETEVIAWKEIEPFEE